MRASFPLVVVLSALAPSTAWALPPVIAFSSPLTVDEGTEITISVVVTDPEGDPVTWSWDLDGDGVFGELPGASSYVVPAEETDGPSIHRVFVQAVAGADTTRVPRTVRINNVAPEITSHPLNAASVRQEYRYEVIVVEPADELEHTLTDSPDGMVVEGGVVTWTPTADQRGRTFDVELVVGDGDGASATQAWTIEVARNNDPTGPTLSAPVMQANVAADEPVTLTVDNGTDPDGDPLTYFFRLSRESSFHGAGLIGSGGIEEGDGDTTSWTTSTPLETGLWYWQAWVSDGTVETLPRHGALVVGDGAFVTGPRPDAGPLAPDAGPPPSPSRGGCSVGARSTDTGGAWTLIAVALGAFTLRRRRMRRASALLIAVLAVSATVSACTVDRAPDDDSGVPAGDDADLDSITNEDEELAAGTDTDEDRVPDALDLDTDDDGLPDWVEAGDDDAATAPRDADGDGIADFRDEDSDDNGIPDAYEGAGDLDRDGVDDYVDFDDDDDNVLDGMELGGVRNPPADSDGDGLPDYRDPDSDDDGILDGDEWAHDTDGDGLNDAVDLDTDGDGLPDSVEAGDSDVYSAPFDRDGDGIHDFRDPDSDNDGLADRAEHESGTDPTRADSDDDGVTDLVELAAGTDPLDRTVSPLTRGDFVFVVPFEADPSPPRDTLSFRTTLQLVDVYFLFDISGSMATEISSLRSAVSMIVGDLTCTSFGTPCDSDGDCGSGQACSLERVCIEDPTLSACVASPWTGGAIYETNLENLISLQDNPARTSTALNVGTFGATENLFRAAWAVADPEGPPGVPVSCEAPTPGRIGCPAFREDAQRILVAFTDEVSNGGSESAFDAGAALEYAGITMIGVWSGTPGAAARRSLVDLAMASHSFSSTGAPLVFDGQDDAVVPVVTAAINEVVEGVPLRVTIEASDEPDDAGNSLQFIDHLEVNTTDPICTAIAPVEDTDDDSHDDAFPSVLPGTPVCWDVVPRRNLAVRPTTEPQVFRARLTVFGDRSPVDSRIVYFLVPPYIPSPDGPD